jgi:hypothetical protein
LKRAVARGQHVALFLDESRCDATSPGYMRRSRKQNGTDDDCVRIFFGLGIPHMDKQDIVNDTIPNALIMTNQKSIVMQATSIHTGNFPADDEELSQNKRPSWRKRADSIIYTVQRRLSSKSLLSDEQAQMEDVIRSLNSKELDTAAKTNYDYLLSPDDMPLKKKSIQAAVQRVLRSKNHSTLTTLDALQRTLAFRQKIGIDELRLAFSNPNEYLEPLYQHLSRGMVYVCGYDKQGRSTYIFQPSCVTNSQDELDWTIRMHVYTLERAIACSKCPEKRVNAVLNFQGFSIRNHKPPMDLGIAFMKTLRDHYSGHVNQVFLIDAPRTFLCLWAVFAPFLAVKTKKRIHFVSGNKQKKTVIGGIYEEDQAPSWMLPGGTLNPVFDPQAYLKDTPFDKAFGEA